jgi:hypothetical protein
VPFVSKAQRRKFYADPKLRKYAAEFEAATPKGAKLPEHVKGSKSKRARRYRVMGKLARLRKR